MRTKTLRAAKGLFDRTHVKDAAYAVMQPFSHRISSLDPEKARARLEQFSPAPSGIAMAAHRLTAPSLFDLRIIVNVYNIEQYIRACVDSILAQESQYSWQLFLVDDGSTDASAQILDAYTTDPRVRVIHQSNEGPSSKNAGLRDLDAAYVMFVDGDDLLEPGAIRTMLDAAYDTDADIVQIGYSRLEDGRKDRAQNVGSMREAPPYGVLTGFAWGKLIRSSLFETVQFPPGYWHMDTIMAFLIHPMAAKRVMLPAFGYVYRCSGNRLSKRAPFSEKCVDTFYITDCLLKEHGRRGLDFDSAFYDELMRQVLLNDKRMRRVPEEIREAVFILTAGLLEQYFEAAGVRPTIHKTLCDALLKRDVGVCRLYCRMHR